MKIKLIFLLPVIGVLLLGGIIGQCFLNYETNTITRDFVEIISEELEKTTVDAIIHKSIEQKAVSFQNEVDVAATQAVAIAALFNRDPVVIDAYKLTKRGDIDNESDPLCQQAREKIRDHFKPLLASYKIDTNSKESLRLHYHLPNGRSLVRLWREGWQAKRDGKKIDISDDISLFRKTVLDINRIKKGNIKGIEVGRGGFSIRGLCAVQDELGGHYGSNEVLMSFNAVFDKLKSSENEAYEVYMVDSLLEVATRLQDPVNHPVRGGFVRVSTTNARLGDQLFEAELVSRGLKGIVFKKLEEHVNGVFPIKDYSGKAIGVVSMYVRTSDQQGLIKEIGDESRRALASIKWVNLFVNLFILGMVVVVVLWISFLISKRTGLLSNTLELVTNGDLTRSIHMDRIAEYKSIGDSFNRLIRKVRLIFRKFYAQVSSMNAYAMELNMASEKAASSAMMLEEKSKSLGSVSKQVDKNANEIANSAELLSSDLISVSGAIEELNASINEIASSCAKERLITENANTMISNSNQIMERLGSSTNEIGSIVDVIHRIAAQTNLLALNATIEAASAGEAGKGFAVVATEVKELAKQSADAAGEIAEQIDKVQQQNQQASASIENLTEVIDTVTQYAASIASSVEEQTAVTQMISENVSNASDNTKHLNEMVHEFLSATREVNDAVKDLRKITVMVNSIAESNLMTATELIDIGTDMDRGTSEFNTGGCYFDINVVKNNHMKWNQKLNDVISGNTNISDIEVSSSIECDFGNWISQVKDRELLADQIFQRMIGYHDQVHVCAKNVVESMRVDDHGAAKTHFKSFQKAKVSMFHELNQLYETSESSTVQNKT